MERVGRPVNDPAVGNLPTLTRLALSALAVLAAVPFGALLLDDAYLALATGAVVIVSAVSWAMSPRFPLAVTIVVALTGLAAGTAVVLAATGTTDPSLLASTLAGMPAQWRALLDSPLAAATTPASLVVPVGGAALAAFAGHELAARSRWPVLGTVPPGVLLVVALLYAGRHASGTPAVVAAFVAGVLIVGATDRRGARGRRLAPAAAIAVAMGAVCLTVAAITPTGDAERFSLSDHYRTEPGDRVSAAPLGQAADALGAPEDPVVFTVTLRAEGGPADAPLPVTTPDGRLRMRTATLDRYDTEMWRPDRPMVPVGDLLSTRYTVPADRPRIVQDITPAPGYPGPFLPVLGTPVEVGSPGRDDLRFDPELGDVLVTTDSPDTKAAQQTFRIVSPAEPAAVPQVPTGEALGNLTAVPQPVPPVLRSLAGGLPAAPRARVEELVERLRSRSAGHDPRANAGHSYARLEQFLEPNPATSQGEAGTIEQQTAAFAVLARLAGLPSRVVVGYEVPLEAMTRSATGHTVDVTARQVRAWAEVHLDGEGWVAIDLPFRQEGRTLGPGPSATTPPTTAIDSGRSPAAAVTVVPGPASSDTPGACAETEPGCRQGREQWTPPWPVSAAAVVVVPIVAILAAKRVRRWRRRRRSPAAGRLYGAWQETVAALRSRGVTVPVAVTATEVADRGRSALGDRLGEPLDHWSRVLDTAVYAPGEPDDALADAAWDAHRSVTDALQATGGPFTRARAALDPRPLVHRS